MVLNDKKIGSSDLSFSSHSWGKSTNDGAVASMVFTMENEHNVELGRLNGHGEYTTDLDNL